jgi:DNA polymerase-3 subunit alpha
LVRGLLVRFAVELPPDDSMAPQEGAVAEVQLHDNARFYPSDAALARWRSQAERGQAVIAYD